jgi:hypothetical protein
MIPKLSPDVDSITIQPTYEVSHIYSFLGWLLRVPLVVGERSKRLGRVAN